MTVKDALTARSSIRAFLDKPVEREKLQAILEAAVRTPSWGNSQPWELFIAQGETLKRIKSAYLEQYAAKTLPEPEVGRPKEWPQSVLNRQKTLHPEMVRDCGDAVNQFGTLNRHMFNAPAVIYICMDRVLNQWSLYDIGAYSQSFMLAALEQGLSTIPAITLAHYPQVLRKELNIPDNLIITIGIALGYADRDNKINNFRSSRSPLEETVHFYN
jgi:nitroreductase